MSDDRGQIGGQAPPAGGPGPGPGGQALHMPGANVGDATFGNVAGHDVQYGADANLILTFLKEYVFLDRQQREIRQLQNDTNEERVIIVLSAICIGTLVNSLLLIAILVML